MGAREGNFLIRGNCVLKFMKMYDACCMFEKKRLALILNKSARMRPTYKICDITLRQIL